MPKRKAPAGPPAPTAGEILSLYRVKIQEKNEARLRRLAFNFRTLTQLDHAIKIPDQYHATTQEVRTPFVRDAWMRTTASLTHNDWLLHVEPKGESDKAKRAAGIAERWAKIGCRAMSKAVEEDVPYEAAKSMVRDAESVIKTVVRNEAWANFPKRTDEDADEYLKKVETFTKGSPFPYAWRNVDRLQMVPGDGEFGDEWYLEFGEYPRPYLARRYGMSEDAGSGRLVRGSSQPDDRGPIRPEDVSPETTLGGRPAPEGESNSPSGISTKVEYWDADWYCVVVDGSMAPGFPQENPYAPRLPYSRARPDAEAEPILYSMLFLVPALDRILTAWTNWMWLGMFPNPILEDVPNSNALPMGLEPPTGDDAASSAFVWRPGKMLEIPKGKKFSFMQPPPVGADAEKMVMILRSLIDIAGIPSVFRGMSASGDSGYLANQMLGAVEMMYKRLGEARSRQLERSVEFMYYTIPTRLKQTVYVMSQGEGGRSWLGLRAEGETTEYLAAVDQLGEVEVTVRPDQDVMQQARAMVARQLTEGPPQQRLMSRRYAMEKILGIEDPDTMADEIWVEEQMATNPAINGPMVEDALRKAGMLPPPQPPQPALVGPNGMPIQSGMSPEMAGLPGQAAAGLPVLPGMGMPMAPQPPQGNGAGPFPGAAGGPPGTYPGLPPNPPVA